MKMKWSLLSVVRMVCMIFNHVDWSCGEVRMIWEYPPVLSNTSCIIKEKTEENSTCDLSFVDENVTIDSLQVVFMTNRCIGGYCRDSVKDRGVTGLMLIECTDIFQQVEDLGMDAVVLLEDACNTCSSNENASSTDALSNDTAVILEEGKSGWWSVCSWSFWKSAPSK